MHWLNTLENAFGILHLFYGNCQLQPSKNLSSIGDATLPLDHVALRRNAMTAHRRSDVIHPDALACTPKTGEGGIRTLGSLLGYGALAKRCFRPLSHLTKSKARISQAILDFQFVICIR